MENNIRIKNINVFRAIIERPWDKTLLEIIIWVAREYGVCFTEGWREARRPGDVHCTSPLRAVDLRSWFYKPMIAQEIEARINARWEYDYARPEKDCAWIHDSGQGTHFHVQVHPNTRRRA